MQRGRNDWSHDLATGSLRGRCPEPAPGDELALCSRDDGQPRFSFRLRPDGSGRYHLPLVPAGPALVRRYFQRDGELQLEVLIETEVRAGVEQVLDLP